MTARVPVPIAALSALLLALGVLLSPGPSATGAPTCPPVIAHRGHATASGPTESSLGAFNAAFSAGSHWIESDAQFTSDGVPVLMHDSTVDRTTNGTGRVDGMTAATFTSLTMNDGQHPPTLAQALDLLRGRPDRHLMLEVKAMTVAQEPTLLGLLAGLENQVFVNAFAPHLPNIQRLKAANPRLTISLVTYSPVLPTPAGISGEDMEYSYVTATNVAQLHAAGMTVRAWVANNSTAWRSLRDMGVDAIMTNEAAAYVRWAVAECGAAPADSTPPTVTSSAPSGGSTVSETVNVTGSASDDVGLDSVSLLVDGAAVASSTAGADGAVNLAWNSATVPNGTHSLQLRARDRAGNLSLSDPVSVTVQNVDDEAPTAPTGLSGTWSKPSHVSLTWTAAHDNGAVTAYRVYRDDAAVADLGPTTLSYTDAGVANVTTYAYRVTALDAAGHESEPSEAATVETGDDTAPTAPSVTADLQGSAAATVSWQGSKDNVAVTGYRVYRNGSLVDTVDAATSSLLVTGLDDGVAYAFTVVAYDAAGNASAPGGPAAVTTPDTTRPSAPGTLTATSGGTSVALGWAAATDNVGVKNYVVHRDGAVLTTLGSTARSYTDSGLDATTPHTYYVTALDAAGLEGPASNVVTRSFGDTTAPAAPTALTRTISGFTVRLTWKASTDNVGVTGYTVYRSGVAVGTTTTATTYTDSTAPPGKTYSYTVRARDLAGNLSAASASVSATLPVDGTAPTAPTALKATAGAAGSRLITLTWGAATDNAGVTSYYVYRGNSKYKLLGNVLTLADSGLVAGTRYTYKVYAIDASGNWSSPTANVSATAR